MPYQILIPDGVVAGFSEEHQIVQTTQDVNYVMTFDSYHHARMWKETYADQGYGLVSEEVMIVEVI
jgi:hypothetical protein